MSILAKLRGQVERAELTYQRLLSADRPDPAAIAKAGDRFRALESELAAEERRLLAGGKLRF